MDISVISDLIGSNYFPIALCIILLYWINKLIENHKEEMLKITEALNNNTVAITILSKNIEELRNDKETEPHD